MTACGVSRGGAGPTKKKRLSTDHLLYLLKLLAFSVFVHTHRERERKKRENFGDGLHPAGYYIAGKKGAAFRLRESVCPFVCTTNDDHFIGS